MRHHYQRDRHQTENVTAGQSIDLMLLERAIPDRYFIMSEALTRCLRYLGHDMTVTLELNPLRHAVDVRIDERRKMTKEEALTASEWVRKLEQDVYINRDRARLAEGLYSKATYELHRKTRVLNRIKKWSLIAASITTAAIAIGPL